MLAQDDRDEPTQSNYTGPSVGLTSPRVDTGVPSLGSRRTFDQPLDLPTPMQPQPQVIPDRWRGINARSQEVDAGPAEHMRRGEMLGIDQQAQALGATLPSWDELRDTGKRAWDWYADQPWFQYAQQSSQEIRDRQRQQEQDAWQRRMEQQPGQGTEPVQPRPSSVPGYYMPESQVRQTPGQQQLRDAIYSRTLGADARMVYPPGADEQSAAGKLEMGSEPPADWLGRAGANAWGALYQIDHPFRTVYGTQLPVVGYSVAQMVAALGNTMRGVDAPGLYLPNAAQGDKLQVSTTFKPKTPAENPFAVTLGKYDQGRQLAEELESKGYPAAKLALINEFSGPDAVLRTLSDMPTQTQRAAQLEESAQAILQVDPYLAAQQMAEAKRIREMTPVQMVDDNMNIVAELAWGILSPDPIFDGAGAVLKLLRLTPEARAVGKVTDALSLVPEQIQRNLSTAVSQQKGLINKLTSGATDASAYYRELTQPWMGTGERISEGVGFFARTPNSRAAQDTEALWGGLVSLTRSLGTDKADIRAVLDALATDPRRLVDGVKLSGQALDLVRGGDGLVRWDPNLVGNNQFARRLPIMAAVREEIVNLPSLKGDGPLDNPTRFYAELYTSLYNASLKLNGAKGPAVNLAGIAKIDVQRIDNTSGRLVFLDADDKVIRQGDAMPILDAQKNADTLRKQMGDTEGKGVMDYISLPVDIQRAVMSDLWLALRPGNWIRNAMSATYMLVSNNAYTLTKFDDIVRDVAGKFGGVVPNSRLFTADTGLEMSQAAKGAGGEVGTSSGAIGWIAKRLTGTADNPVTRAMNTAYSIPYGKTEIPLGSAAIPVGEQAFYARAWYVPFRRALEQDFTGRVVTMVGEMAERMGIDPDTARVVQREVVRAGMEGNGEAIAQAMRKLATSDTMPNVLRDLGVNDEILPLEQYAKLNELLAEAVPDTLGNLAPRIKQVFQDARTHWSDVMSDAPPQPGTYESMLDEGADEAVWLASELDVAAKRAGTLTPEVKAQNAQAAKAWHDALSQATTSLAGELKAAPNTPATWNVAIDYWFDIYAARADARKMVDEARRTARAGGLEWPAYFDQVRKAYGDMAVSFGETSTKYRSALMDASAGNAYKPKHRWGDVLERYIQFDKDKLQELRAQVLGAGSKVADDIFDEMLFYSRRMTENSLAEVFEAFRRYPSLESYDRMAAAMLQTERIGAAAAKATDLLRQQALTGAMSWPDFYRQTSKIWADAFDEQSLYHKGLVYHVVMNGLANEVGQHLTWTEPGSGTQWRLRGPGNTEGKWAAENVDNGDVVEDFTPGDGTTPWTAPQQVVDDYARIMPQVEAEADDVIRQVARAAWARQHGMTSTVQGDYTFSPIGAPMPRVRGADDLPPPADLPPDPEPRGPIAPTPAAPAATPETIIAKSKSFAKMSASEIVASVEDELRAAGFNDAEIDALRKSDRNSVLDIVEGIRDETPEEVGGPRMYDRDAYVAAAVESSPLVQAARASADESVVEATEDLVAARAEAMYDGIVDTPPAPTTKLDDNLTALHGGLGLTGIDPAIMEKLTQGWKPFARAMSGLLGDGRRTRQVAAPQMGDLAYHSINNLDVLERRILDDLPRLTMPRPNTMNRAQRMALMDMAPKVQGEYGKSLEVARRIGDEMGNHTMLDFGDRRNFDTTMALLFPYHYFWSRMPSRALMAALQKPGLVKRAYEIKDAIRRENEREQMPQKFEGTAPMPNTNWRMGGDTLLDVVIPGMMYMSVNPFIETEGAEGLDLWVKNVQKFSLGLGPMQQVMYDLARDGKLDGYATLNDFLPIPPQSVRQAITGEMGRTDQAMNPIKVAEFDPWRARTTAAVIGQERGIDPTVVQDAQQIINNQARGLPIANGIKGGDLNAAQNLAAEAVRRAAQERLMSRGISFATGVPAYRYAPADRDLRAISNDYRTLAYPANPMGSRAALNAHIAANPMLSAWWTRTEEGDAPGQSAQRSRRYEEQQAVYARQAEAVDALLRANPNASAKEVRAVKDQFQPELDAINEKYALESRDPSAYGLSPREQAQRQVEAILRHEPEGKPQFPGEESTPEEKRLYYAEMADWNKKRILAIDAQLRALAGKGGPPDNVTGEARGMVAGQYTSDLVRRYENRYASELEYQWSERMALAGEYKDAQWARRNDDVKLATGQKGLDLFIAYNAIDDDAKKAEFKAANPLVGAAVEAAYHPDEYNAAVRLFGDDWYMVYSGAPEYPGGDATEQEMEAYYTARNKYQQENPDFEKIRLWYNGRPKASDPATEAAIAKLGYFPRDYGKDYAAVMTWLPEETFQWRIELNAAYDQSDDIGRRWIRSNPDKWMYIKAYQEWYKELGEQSTYPMPAQQAEAQPPLPGQYQGPRPMGSDMQPMGGVPGQPPAWNRPVGNDAPRQFTSMLGYTPDAMRQPQQAVTPAAQSPLGRMAQPPAAPTPPAAGGNQGIAMEYAMRDPKFAQGQANEAEWQARRADVGARFGPETASLYDSYLALPKGTARAEFKAQHPQLRAVSLAVWNAPQYDYLVSTYGQEAVMVWARTPAWSDTSQARAARSAYYDLHPEAFEINAWLYGRPGGDEGGGEDETTFSYNFGADYEQAQELFGADIWNVVANYKRGWDKGAKAAYFDQNPQLSDFFDWWYGNLEDQVAVATNRSTSGYGRGYGSYGGGGGYRGGYGGGGGGGGGTPGRVNVRIDPRYMDRRLWPELGRLQAWRPMQQDYAAQRNAPDIGPEKLRRWRNNYN
jgi:hypothetical protein